MYPIASFTLNNQPCYNNLTFNLTGNTNVATLENNLTVYGTLTVEFPVPRDIAQVPDRLFHFLISRSVVPGKKMTISTRSMRERGSSSYPSRQADPPFAYPLPYVRRQSCQIDHVDIEIAHFRHVEGFVRIAPVKGQIDIEDQSVTPFPQPPSRTGKRPVAPDRQP